MITFNAEWFITQLYTVYKVDLGIDLMQINLTHRSGQGSQVLWS